MTSPLQVKKKKRLYAIYNGDRLGNPGTNPVENRHN